MRMAVSSNPPTGRAATLRLHPDDHVAVALRDLAVGEAVEGVTVREPIPAGHKIAVAARRTGEAVHKYGQVIGVASLPIEPGAHVHTQTLEFGGLQHDAGGPVAADRRQAPVGAPAMFDGYRRADGRAATRNYLGVVTSVNCSATVARGIARGVERLLGDYPNIDGVVPITHSGGCAMASSGEGMDVLRRTLAGYARHANFAGVVMVGLGCETNQVSKLVEAEGLVHGDRFDTMTIQEAGGTARAIAAGVERLAAMLPQANRVARTPIPASELIIGMQCGGSDGYSGITANPALGAAADLLVAHGGTAILSETPEIYGAEHLLTRRAVSPEVARALLDRIAWWERHTAQTGGSMDNNPSAGNKAGGLTTILEKSLGAVAKGGSSPLSAVYGYAEPVTGRGFVFMDSPGYDPVSATGQVAGGANVICFTTGRGSVFGCKPAPSIKLATNSDLYRRMPDDMDIDCGVILEQQVSIPEMGRRIFELILETASGRRTKSEELGFGDDEFQPWQLGAVM